MSAADNHLRPAIFFDRDGVIIENRANYVRSWGDVSFIPGALAALARLASTGFAVVIVTNQAGVGHGLIPRAVAETINDGVRAEIVRSGGRVDGLYLCPHIDADHCDCRKPRPGMLLRAARDLGLDLSRSWLIGDALTDLQAGEAAGVRSLLVFTGRGAEQKAIHGLDGFESIVEALNHIGRQNG